MKPAQRNLFLNKVKELRTSLDTYTQAWNDAENLEGYDIENAHFAPTTLAAEQAFVSTCVRLSTEFRDAGFDEKQWLALLRDSDVGLSPYIVNSWRPEVTDKKDIAYFTAKMVTLSTLFNSEAGKAKVDETVPRPEMDRRKTNIWQRQKALSEYLAQPHNVFEQEEQKLVQEFKAKGYSAKQYRDLMVKCGAEAQIKRPQITIL